MSRAGKGEQGAEPERAPSPIHPRPGRILLTFWSVSCLRTALDGETEVSSSGQLTPPPPPRQHPQPLRDPQLALPAAASLERNPPQAFRLPAQAGHEILRVPH